jgi:hypothetical protein
MDVRDWLERIVARETVRRLEKRMWNPFSKAKNALIRKGTEQAIKPLEQQIGGFVAEQKASPLKGWRTVLINGGILAVAAFLQFLAGVPLEDLGVSPTVAVFLLTVINGLLRAVTTTPMGKNGGEK